MIGESFKWSQLTREQRTNESIWICLATEVAVQFFTNENGFLLAVHSSDFIPSDAWEKVCY